MIIISNIKTKFPLVFDGNTLNGLEESNIKIQIASDIKNFDDQK